MPHKKSSFLDDLKDTAEEVVEGVVEDVTSGHHIKLPTKIVRTAVSVGVQAVRRAITSSKGGKRTMKALEAGQLTDLFGRAGKTGGAAFERWVVKQGINPKLPKTQAEWDVLLNQFVSRPMHGHRRSARNSK